MQQDFLETIEGTSGEELTSAVLKYLIVNSPVFRDCLIARIAASVPPGHAPSFRNGLFCRTEYPTDSKDGFIDILLCDGEPNKISFVAALEVKLWAAFTDNQPAKYVGTLQQMVKDPSSLLIIVLAPDERIDDVRDHLRKQHSPKPAIPWAWSKIGEDLEQVAQDDSPSVSLVAKWLLRFLKVRIGEKTLQGTPDAYVGPNVILGNKYHYDFLYKLKSCLPSPGRIILRDTGDKYIGLSCECVTPERPGQSVAKVWIGFVPKRDGTIVFGIDSELPYQELKEGTFRHWDREFREIPFAAELKTALQWQKRLTEELFDIQDRKFPSGAVVEAKLPS